MLPNLKSLTAPKSRICSSSARVNKQLRRQLRPNATWRLKPLINAWSFSEKKTQIFSSRVNLFFPFSWNSPSLPSHIHTRDSILLLTTAGDHLAPACTVCGRECVLFLCVRALHYTHHNNIKRGKTSQLYIGTTSLPPSVIPAHIWPTAMLYVVSIFSIFFILKYDSLKLLYNLSYNCCGCFICRPLLDCKPSSILKMSAKVSELSSRRI